MLQVVQPSCTSGRALIIAAWRFQSMALFEYEMVPYVSYEPLKSLTCQLPTACRLTYQPLHASSYTGGMQQTE